MPVLPAENPMLPESPEMAKAPQAMYEALPRFGASLFATITPAGPAGAGKQQVKPTEGQPAGNLPVPPNYLLGPGDTLALSVWSRDFEQVKQTLTVSPEGFVVLPQVGRVTAAGQTLEQLRQGLTQSYARLFVDPAVTLVVSEQRTVEVYVTGDAVRPGKYALSGMATVLTALYAAGGPSDIGSFRTIRLNRVGQKPVEIDLYDYLLTGRRDSDIVLAPGDSIFVPPVAGEVGLTGELRRPARYELKPGMTVAQALELAGGLKPSGYAPTLHLWRADKQAKWALSMLDAADPQSADLKQVVRDGDLIIVKRILPTGQNTVELMGAVKRPGYYPVVEGVTVSSLLRSAEGLRWDAHMGTGVVRRMDYDRHYQIITFNVSEQMYGKNPPVIPLEPKDEVEVFVQSAVEPAQEVRVEGAVANPGTYPYAGQMRISHLILQAGSLLPEAYVDRAELLRLTPDQKYEIIPVNLKAALLGGTADVLVQRGDILKVSKLSEALAPQEVQIAGFVRNPGNYTRREGMKVSDLIFAAGGLKPGAGPKVEVIPGHFEGTPKPVALTLQGGEDKFTLEPDMLVQVGDSVTVDGRGEFKERADLAVLAGRVAQPGSYAIKRAGQQGYTVYDMIRDGGGVLADANPNGIVVYRRRDASIGQAQNEDLTKILQSVNRETAQQKPLQVDQQAQAMSASVASGLTALVSPSATSIVLPPRAVTPEDYVMAIPISGNKLLASEGKEGNLELEPGDNVVVPRRVNTVTVLGAVPRSGAVPYVGGERARLYITEAGGYREDAASERMVVVHQNGSAAPIKLSAEIEPGDIIVVPTKHIVRTVRTESAWQQWMRGIVGLITAALVF
ncbi:MAG: SLBB domain-containing protein [Armatimonadia bacterium]